MTTSGKHLGVRTPVENVNAPCLVWVDMYGWMEIDVVIFRPGIDEPDTYELRFALPVYEGMSVGLVESVILQAGDVISVGEV